MGSRSWPKKSSTSGSGADKLLPESPKEPMEFLSTVSRSWRSNAPLSPRPLRSATANANDSVTSIPKEVGIAGEVLEGESEMISGINTFSFASSSTSQLVLQRIMSQSEISPLTSGRLSHSSGPLNCSITGETDSPPIPPSEELDDIVKYLHANNTLKPLFSVGHNGCGSSGNNTPGGTTVGRWLKERREKKKEENRARNAQLHAAISVAKVAAAVAAIAAGTAALSASGKDEKIAKTDMAVASAATLVAAQCVEAAETMGAERDHLVSAVNSAVSIQSHEDILTLTAAAATALRGAATLKARALKEVWNVAAVIPVEKGLIKEKGHKSNHLQTKSCSSMETYRADPKFLGVCNLELLARGSELLKRTRKGDLHWKIVSVYIHRTGQVMLKMKSRHVAGTITKKKKNVVLEVYKDVPAWPGRHLFDGGEQRRYFGLKTSMRGVVEFECKNQREYEMWTRGVSRLLAVVAEQKNRV